MVRTALFNWAYARHTGGKLIFRIEDTDAARDSEESYQAIIESLIWLGMDWDEGVVTGGPNEPYRQSQRMDIYLDVLEKLKDAGEVYPSYSTPEEVEERHKAAGRDPKLGYDNYDRELTADQIAAFEAEGRKPVWRLRMPDHDWEWTDLVRGDISFKASTQPDYVVARSNGAPLYTLVNPVDDALMGITHVLRGEDLLPSTPRQLALYDALKRIGVATHTPEFGHLPFVMGEGNNADHIRLLPLEDFSARLRTYLEDYKGFPASYPDDKFRFVAELVQTRIKKLDDAWDLVRFLIVSDEELVLDEKSARKNLKEDAVQPLEVAISVLSDVPDWDTASIESALQKALIEDLGLKPRKAYGALRVGISGQAISPPLFESMELLGRESTLARLRAAREVTPYSAE